MKNLITFSIFFIALNGYAQGIIGPSQACPGATGVNYSIQVAEGGIGAGFYAWRLNGSRAGGNVPNIAITIPSTGTSHVLTVQYTPFVGSIENYSLIINTLAVGVVSANVGTVCGGGSVQISFANGSGTWWEKNVNGAGWVAVLTPWLANPLIETITQNTAYRLVLDTNPSGAGCGYLASNTVSIIVNPVPSLPNTTNAARCGDGTLTLTASQGSNGDQVRWYNTTTGGSLLAIGNSYSTPALSATTSYWVSTFNTSTGCESSRAQVIATIHPIPAPSSVANAARCGAGTTVLAGSAGSNGNTIRWYDAPTGGNLLETSLVFTTPSLSGSTSYWTASYNTSTGCETNTRQQVTAIINPIPAVPAAGNAARCGPGSIALSGSPGSNSNTLNWFDNSVGGAILSTGTSFNINDLPVTTTYWISSLNTSTGCESPTRTAVTAIIHPIPKPPAVNHGAHCGAGIVNLSASPGGDGNEVRWYNTSSGGAPFRTDVSYQTPSLTTTTAYWVSTYNNTTFCESPRAQVIATINAIPNSPALNPAQRCGSGSVTLTGSPGASGDAVNWWDASSGGNLLVVSGSLTTPNLVVSTQYWASTKNTITGCESPRASAMATINPIPDAPLGSSSARCGPGSVRLNATPGVNGTSVNWYANASGGSALASGVNFGTPSLQSSTLYWASSINNATGCEGSRIQVQASINALPTLASGVSQSRCDGGLINLTANPGANGNSIRWYAAASGGSILATGINYSPAPQATTTYYAATFNTGTGCEATTRHPITATILVSPPAPTVSGYFGRFGFGSITLTASGLPVGASWQWMDVNGSNLAGANADSYSVELPATTTFKVKFIASNGCEGPHSNVTANIVPIPVITGSGNPYLATGQTIHLTIPSVYASYQWKRDGQNIAGALQPALIVNQFGRYSVVTTLPNGLQYESDEFDVAELTNEVENTVQSLENNPPPVIAFQGRKNFVRTYTAKKPGLSDTAFTYAAFNKADVAMATQYLDGIGMPVQLTDRQASPTGKDVLVHQEYDEFGREQKTFLPFSSTSIDMDVDGYRKNAKVEQYTFYRSGTTDVAVSGVPFAERQFEASPLNRALVEGGPGESWKIGSGHEKKYDYHALGSQDAPVRFFEVNSSNQLVQSGIVYAPRELMVTEVQDENGNAVLEYKNRESQTILKRARGDGSEWLDTYYVYDARGNLRFVLPPLLSNKPYPFTQSAIDSLAFQYVYDSRQRQIEKRIPGSGWTYMIYDQLDRLVLTQSPNQRIGNKWSFTKYDIYNRPVLSGEYTDNTPYLALRSSVSAQSGYETKTATFEYTLNGSLPVVAITSVHVQTFYDDYKLPAPFSVNHKYAAESTLTGFGTGSAARSNWARGLVTASLTRNLESGAWLESVIYYDTRARVLQTISRNVRNTLDRTTNAYENTISPTVLKTVTRHNVGGGTNEVKIEIRVAYDDQDRPTTIHHKIGSRLELRLANHRYNEIGQLVEKNLYSAATVTSWLQSLDMTYNIRGYLLGINNATLTGGEISDQFGMELFYDAGYRHKQYNGNISGLRWKTVRTGQEHSYGYVYDPLNRLRVAQYSRKNTVTGSWNLETDRFSEVIKRYDANGNIMELERFGLVSGPTTFGKIDNLMYAYAGNQLQKVTDLSTVAAGFTDDSTPNGAEADYSFDANGNQVRDDNKRITQIEYNHLNLPRRVTKNTGEYLVYEYDGTGRKLKQTVFSSTGTITKQTEYVGGFVYENNVLQFANHAEGRVVRVGSNWQYQFFLKDHLGNVRATIAPRRDVYTANFETSTNSAFRNYTRVNLDLFDRTDAGTVRTFSQRLTGAANSRVGIARSLAVNAGDTVQVEVWAKYLGTSSGTVNLAGFASALLGAFGLAPPAVGETGTAAAAISSYGALVASGGNQGNAAWPKGWLNVLVFDDQFNLVDVAFQQLDAAFVQPVGSTIKEPHQQLSRQVIITKPGFVYIYVSNEGTVLQDIHFDDMRITHRQLQLIQEDAYYAFGMTHSSYTLPNVPANPYKYNGKEVQDELNVGWLDYGARMYDNTTGRWGVVDPLAEASRRWSPYNYAYNNPIRFIDPDGMAPVQYGFSAGSAETGSVSRYGAIHGSIKMGDEEFDDFQSLFDAHPDLIAATVDNRNGAIVPNPEVMRQNEGLDPQEPQAGSGPGDPITFFADMVKAWFSQFSNDNKEEFYTTSGSAQNEVRIANTVVNTVSQTQVTPYFSASFGKYGGMFSDNYTLTITPDGLYMTAGMDMTLDSGGGLPNIGGSFGFMIGPKDGMIGPGWGTTGGAFFMGLETGGSLNYTPNISLGRPSSFGFAVSTSSYWGGVNGGYTFQLYKFR